MVRIRSSSYRYFCPDCWCRFWGIYFETLALIRLLWSIGFINVGGNFIKVYPRGRIDKIQSPHNCLANIDEIFHRTSDTIAFVLCMSNLGFDYYFSPLKMGVFPTRAPKGRTKIMPSNFQFFIFPKNFNLIVTLLQLYCNLHSTLKIHNKFRYFLRTKAYSFQKTLFNDLP